MVMIQIRFTLSFCTLVKNKTANFGELTLHVFTGLNPLRYDFICMELRSRIN